MPTHKGPKRATAAPPPRARGLRAAWLVALSVATSTAAAGWLAADAASALGSESTTATTVTAAPATAATATVTTTATTATATTPTATTTATTSSTATTPSAATTTATTSTATTSTATTKTTATKTTATKTTATTATATTATATTPARVSGTQTEPASVTPTATTSTVTVTVTTPAPSTSSATGTSSDSDAATDSAVTDPLSTTLGTDSATLAAQSDLNETVLSATRPPAALIRIYKAAAESYDVPWEVLAAINAVESDYGTNEGTSSAGAVGWMQFEPATFAKYAIPNGTGRSPSPYNDIDAIFAAAHLLSANGASTDLRTAIYAYNHADWYVDEVTFLAAQIAGSQTTETATASAKITAMTTTAKLLEGTPYVWGGGHGSWTSADGYDCSGFVSAVLHAAGYLSEPETTQTLPAAADIESGPGQYVTMFDRTDGAGITDDHVIIDIDGQWWEEGGGTGDGGADDVHRIADVSTSYLASFNLELHPKGL